MEERFMSVNDVQKAVTYVKEAQEVALFAAMTDSRWFAAFGASPLFYIILPFIGVLLTTTAIINGYRLAKADNKNLDQWFNLSASVLCATLASVSLYGAALAVLLGTHFAAGPWFFFSSLLVGITHQSIMMGINFYRFFEATEGSVQRKHSLQAVLNNLFILGLLSSVVGCVVFVMLFPTVAPLVGVSFAVSAVALNLVHIMWRIIPHNWKLATKGAIALGKPELPQTLLLKPVNEFEEVNTQHLNPNHHKLFSRYDHSVEVRKMDVESAKDYLCRHLLKKIESYGSGDALRDHKSQDKHLFLNKLLHAVTEPVTLSKRDLLKKHPMAFQSFWVEKGEVEQLFDAVVAFHDKLNCVAATNDAALGL